MNKYAVAEENVLRGPEVVGTAHLPAPVGTFSLRRAHYLTGAGKSLLAAEQLTADQQQALIKLAGEGDADAKRKLVAQHMYMVIDFAKRYANSGPTPLDLIREGNRGLVRALEKFEPESGASFLDYATLCIRQYIERAIMNRGDLSCRRAACPPVIPRDAPLQMPVALPGKETRVIIDCRDRPLPPPSVSSSKSITIGGCHGLGLAA